MTHLYKNGVDVAHNLLSSGVPGAFNYQGDPSFKIAYSPFKAKVEATLKNVLPIASVQYVVNPDFSIDYMVVYNTAEYAFLKYTSSSSQIMSYTAYNINVTLAVPPLANPSQKCRPFLPSNFKADPLRHHCASQDQPSIEPLRRWIRSRLINSVRDLLHESPPARVHLLPHDYHAEQHQPLRLSGPIRTSPKLRGEQSKQLYPPKLLAGVWLLSFFGAGIPVINGQHRLQDALLVRNPAAVDKSGAIPGQLPDKLDNKLQRNRVRPGFSTAGRGLPFRLRAFPFMIALYF